MNRHPDRPPVFLFLLWFTALLALALGLAVIAPTTEAANPNAGPSTESAVNQAHPAATGSDPQPR